MENQTLVAICLHTTKWIAEGVTLVDVREKRSPETSIHHSKNSIYTAF